MAKRVRDYPAERRRRNEKAREEGWSSHDVRYKATKRIASDPNLGSKWRKYVEAEGLESADWKADPVAFAAFAAITDKKLTILERWEAKREWFVKYAGAVASYEVWDENYPKPK